MHCSLNKLFLFSVEGLFNANCLVAHLLDAIKKKHKLPREGTNEVTLE